LAEVGVGIVFRDVGRMSVEPVEHFLMLIRCDRLPGGHRRAANAQEDGKDHCQSYELHVLTVQ